MSPVKKQLTCLAEETPGSSYITPDYDKQIFVDNTQEAPKPRSRVLRKTPDFDVSEGPRIFSISWGLPIFNTL